MLYVFIFFIGALAGGSSVFLALVEQRRRLKEQRSKQDARAKNIEKAVQTIRTKQQQLDERTAQLKAERKVFDGHVVSYKDLEQESVILKRDLQNIDVNLRKLQLDRDLQRQTHEELSQRIGNLGSRYLKENVKWIGSSLTTNNFVASKQRLQGVIERCRGIGFDVPGQEEAVLLANLKEEYEKMVRAAFEREEQARIKAQIREEQRLQREVEREVKKLDTERAAIQAALDKALAEAKDEHTEEIERLKARLAEAEEKSQRAISRAQMTKSGHVYVISNIGSFGEGIYKIGMTRRLEPAERIRELSSASVPFPYDVHMMISCDDAPKLENCLHRGLHKLRINKINPRKEFFKADVEAIREIVEENHGEVQYAADPEALEYRQSLTISDEDYQFIESVYDALDEEEETVAPHD